MADELRDIEPFYGWLPLYDPKQDERSPFYEIEHNLFYFDRSINHIPAHPLWEDFGSESLLLKILFVNYEEGYAVIELFGEWNDLYDNDFKLLAENVLTFLIDHGINRYMLICENVFNTYLEADDYYAAIQEELEDGWICLLRARPRVKEEMEAYGMSSYVFWSEKLDALPWRTLKPPQLLAAVEQLMSRLLG